MVTKTRCLSLSDKDIPVNEYISFGVHSKTLPSNVSFQHLNSGKKKNYNYEHVLFYSHVSLKSVKQRGKKKKKNIQLPTAMVQWS